MADRAKKKEKHRLKRAKKQRANRKASAMTPLYHIAHSGGDLECLITDGWEEEGIANIFVLGTAPDGRHAFAAFLVDAWCVGLKDVWGEARIGREDFADLIKRAGNMSPLVEADPDEVRKLVAGAIRFSRQNGFKLPAGWDKWVGIFGGLDDIAQADLSRFGKDEGLLYVGTKKFLRDRLVGCTAEEFMDRPDVKVALRAYDPDDLPVGMEAMSGFEDLFDEDEDEDGDHDEESEEAFDAFDGLPADELIEQLAPKLGAVMEKAIEEKTAAIAETLHRLRVTPHPRLNEAMGYVASLSLSAAALQGLGMAPPSFEDCREAIEELMVLHNEADRDSLREAIEQVNLAAEADARVDLKAMLSSPAPRAC